MSILFYDKNTIKNIDIQYPDIYFTPEYGELCEYSDNASWECCVYNDLIYVYLKKEIIYNNTIYYSLISPYGYSGYYYKYKKTFDNFIPIFRKEAYNKNYLYEILRQNPYININITNYDIIKSKKLYCIKINSFDEYYKIMSDKKRNMYNKGIKNNYEFIINDTFNDDFINLYHNKMNILNANKYYYFNDNYFKKLNNIKLINVTNIKHKNNLIGSSIIFKYNNFIHYHLSANDNSSNCITDYLIFNLVKKYNNKFIILGCGIDNNDSLDKYKKSLSNINFNYVIYKNIINQQIYDNLKNSLILSHT